MTTMDRLEKTIQAGEFKAKCLAILDEVNKTGQTLVITKHGKPVAKVVPIEKPPSLKGSVIFEGDILSPVLDPWEWDVNK